MNIDNTELERQIHINEKYFDVRFIQQNADYFKYTDDIIGYLKIEVGKDDEDQ
jgi:hypothetical protein